MAPAAPAAYNLSGNWRRSSASANVYVGQSGSGNFTQTNGTDSISGCSFSHWLTLPAAVAPTASAEAAPTPLAAAVSISANTAHATGAYGLTGNSQLSATSAYVGYLGTGSFTQSGGSTSISGTSPVTGLYLGYMAGSAGTYSLGGAACSSTPKSSSAPTGKVSFIQSGGTNSTPTLFVGESSSGTYSLSGNAQLSGTEEYLSLIGSSSGP